MAGMYNALQNVYQTWTTATDSAVYEQQLAQSQFANQYAQAQAAVKPTVESALAWLDRRVNEMRVAL